VHSNTSSAAKVGCLQHTYVRPLFALVHVSSISIIDICTILALHIHDSSQLHQYMYSELT
jgi:hypothetical protein